MPNIDVPQDATPGAMFRAIADWYDQTGEPMPDSVSIHHHARGAGGPQYPDLLAERYGVPVRRLNPDPAAPDIKHTVIQLMNRWAATTPTVTLHAYGPTASRVS